MENETNTEKLAVRIKRQLLTQRINTPCCKRSFLTGAEVFEKSRRNDFTDALDEMKIKLSKKKKNSFFEEPEDIGYMVACENGEKYPMFIPGKTCQHCHSYLLRGAFLACGRASESAEGYHIELPVPNENTLKMVMGGFGAVKISPKTAIRRGERIVYLKKRDSVADFIAYIGAHSVSIDISLSSIEKRFRADANRQKNCDTTNIMRSVSAAERQVAAIRAIEAHGALDKLPPGLRETAVIRLENQIESLDEITALHGDGISRSGVNHRLAKIIEFAEKNGYIVK